MKRFKLQIVYEEEDGQGRLTSGSHDNVGDLKVAFKIFLQAKAEKKILLIGAMIKENTDREDPIVYMYDTKSGAWELCEDKTQPELITAALEKIQS